MSEGRGLLTEKERRAIAGELSDSYRYKTRSYYRARLDELEKDVDVLAAEAPDLLEELRDVVQNTDHQVPRDARELAETATFDERDQSPSRPPEREIGDHHHDADEPLSETLDDVEFPSGKDRDACVDAVLAARMYLKNKGSATMRDIVVDLSRDHPLGYDPDSALAKVEAGERYRGAWWRRIVRPGLETFDDVEKPAPGASKWRYTGDR